METLQLDLFEIEAAEVPETEKTIEERFWEFHEDNLHVARRLRALAHQLKASGHSQYGMRALFEVLRFETSLETTGRRFKLNNNYTALYARWLMIWDPELKGFFVTRDHDKEQDNGV